MSSEKDARGQRSAYQFDHYGRVVQRIDDADNLTSSLPASQRTHSWVYDSAPGKGLGLLAAINGFDTRGDVYTESFEYDNIARIHRKSYTIAGVSDHFNTVYDTYGRLRANVYPTGYMVEYRYNTHGHNDEVWDVKQNSLMWQANGMDARGNLEQFTYGNGVVVDQTFVPSTGRIDTIVGTSSTNLVVQDHNYDFSPLGNLVERQDNKRAITQSFCYDSLNRLVDDG